MINSKFSLITAFFIFFLGMTTGLKAQVPVNGSRPISYDLHIPQLASVTDSIKVCHLLSRYPDRVYDIKASMQQKKVNVSFTDNTLLKDLMEVLLANGYTSYYLLGDKKYVLRGDRIEVWDVKP